MEIEVKERSQVKAKIYGQELLLKKPTVGQIEAMQAEVAKAEDGKQLSIMKSFAVQLGLPLPLIETMEVDHFVSVIEQLSGTKKK